MGTARSFGFESFRRSLAAALAGLRRTLMPAAPVRARPARRFARLQRLEDRNLLSVTPLGTEFRVNTFTANPQRTSPSGAPASQAVAAAPGGNFVVTWSSQNQDGNGWGVYGQRYDAAGMPQGAEFRVNSTTAGDQLGSAVAVDGLGNIVIAWSSQNQDGSGNGVYAQRYDAAGTPLGGEFRVNTTTTGDQQGPAVAADATGNFVVTWSTDENGQQDVFAQRFDAAGNPLGGESQVNTRSAGDQQGATVAMTSAGTFVVAWSSQGQDGSGYGVYAQRYDASGNRQGGEFRVNGTTADDQQDPAVAVDAAGDFVIAWSSHSSGLLGLGANWDVYARRYDATGTAQGGEALVNTTTSSDQVNPAVSADPSGNYVIAWSSFNPGLLGLGGDWDVNAQRYRSSGAADGGELLVNTTTSGDQQVPSVAADAGGTIAVVWSGNGTGDGDGVFGRLYQAPAIAVTPTAGLVTTEAGGSASFQVVLTTRPTASVTVGLSSSDTSEGTVSASSLTFTTANWNVPQTVTVTGVDDFVADGNLAYTIVTAPASSTDANYGGLNPADVAVVNQDNDVAGIRVSPTSGLVTTEAGGTATFQVALTSQPVAPVTVTLTSSDSTQGTPAIGSLTFDPSNWNVAQTVLVTGQDDGNPGSQPYAINLSASGADANYNGATAAVALTNAPIPVLVVDTSSDVVDGNTSSITALLGGKGADGHVSLREALLAANNTTGTDRIVFSIGSGVQTIRLAAGQGALPAITDPVILDGTTQPGYGGTPLIVLDGSQAGTSANGLTIQAGSSTVRGLVISHFGGSGIELDTNGNNRIEGNFIGTDATGRVAAANATGSSSAAGLLINNSPNNVIGGTSTAQRNLISGNAEDGVDIIGSSTGNVVAGNYLGTDFSGTLALGNHVNGVWLSNGASNNTIGGTAPGAGNLIAGNVDDGVEIEGSNCTGNRIAGNTIGTDATGTLPLGNDSGVVIQDAPGNQVGGTATGAGNLLSGNLNSGILVFGSNATGNVIEGNLIGTDRTGTRAVGNTPSGILLDKSGDGTSNIGFASNTAIGGIAPGAGNTIANNAGAGVVLVGGTGNAIRGNVLFGNTGLGIDLGNNGVTPNDAGDGDNGANGLQNFPVLTTAQVTGSSLSVTGTLNSAANTSYTIDVYASPASDPSGHGQGRLYLGSTTVRTDGSGNASFAITLSVTGVAGQTISATTTDPAGNTSEFAADRTATGLVVTPTSSLTTTETGGAATFTVQLVSQPLAPVTVTLTSSSSVEGTAAPTTLTFTASNWNAAQTVTVTGQDDHIVHGDQPYAINLAASSAGDPNYNGLTASVSLVNQEADVAGITVTPTSGLTTSESGQQATFTIVLTSQPTASVTVGLSSSDTSEGTASAASLTFTAANWNVPQTVTVTGVDDFVADSNVTYRVVTASAVSADPVYNGMNPADVSLVNNDNDTAGIRVTPTSGLVTTEAGGTASFTVVLTSQPTASVTVGLSSADTSEGTVSASSLTFSAANWNVPQTVTVTGVDDFVAEGNIAYTILTVPAVSADPVYNGMNASDVAVTNRDNDTAGVQVQQSVGPAGGEFRVNTTTTGPQQTAPGARSVAADNSGNFVVVWSSQNQDGSGWGVYGQRYDDAGNPLGGEFRVNTFTTGDQQQPAVAANSNGFVVVWQSQNEDGSGWGIYAQRYDAAGNRLGGELLVNTTTNGDQISPAVALASDGTFEVAWSGQGGGNWDVYLRQLDASGNPLTGEQRVNTTAFGAPESVSLAGNTGGSFVVAWAGSTSGSSEVYARPYDKTATPLAGQLPVNTTTVGDQLGPSVAIASSGNFVVAWSSANQDGDGWGVYARRFDATGGALGGEFRVNTTTTGDQQDAALDSDNAGNFAVVWQSPNQDGSGYGVYAQRYGASGNPLGGEFRINTTTANDQLSPAVAASGNGFVTAWSSQNQDGSSYGVYAQRYSNDPTVMASLLTTEAGGTATFTVRLTSQPTAGVTIALNNTNPVEGRLSAGSLTFDATNWNVAQTVTVTGLDDHIVHGNVTYPITFAVTSADPGYDGRSVPNVLVTNQEADQAGVVVSPTAGLTTTKTGGQAVFTVVLTSAPTANVTLTLASSDTNEGVVSAPALTFTPANWNVPQTVTVTGVDDFASGPVAYVVAVGPASSADPVYNGLIAPAVALTNVNTPAVRVSPVAGLVTTEAGGTASFQVVLTSVPTTNVTVTLASSNTAEGTVSPTTLTFTAATWNVPQTVTVTGVDDRVTDGNVAYAVTAAVVSGDPAYNAITVPSVALTNRDDDSAGLQVTPTSGLVVTAAGGNATFTVVLTSQPTGSVTVALTSSNPGAGQPAQPALTFTPGDWNVPQTIAVAASPAVQGEVSFAVHVATTSSDPGYNGRAGSDVLVTAHGVLPVPLPPTPPSPPDVPGPSVGETPVSTPGAGGQGGQTPPPDGGGTSAVAPPAVGGQGGQAVPPGGEETSAPTVSAASTEGQGTHAVPAGTEATPVVFATLPGVSPVTEPAPARSSLAPAPIVNGTGAALAPATGTAGFPGVSFGETVALVNLAAGRDATARQDASGQATSAIVSASLALTATTAQGDSPAAPAGVLLNLVAFAPDQPAQAPAAAPVAEVLPESRREAPASFEAFRALVAADSFRPSEPSLDLPQPSDRAVPPDALPAAAPAPAPSAQPAGMAASSAALWQGPEEETEAVRGEELVREAELVVGTGVVASAGYVLLNTRAGLWALSVLTARPLWKQFDPLEILFAWEQEEQRRTTGEGETLQSLVEGTDHPSGG